MDLWRETVVVASDGGGMYIPGIKQSHVLQGRAHVNQRLGASVDMVHCHCA